MRALFRITIGNAFIAKTNLQIVFDLFLISKFVLQFETITIQALKL